MWRQNECPFDSGLYIITNTFIIILRFFTNIGIQAIKCIRNNLEIE